MTVVLVIESTKLEEQMSVNEGEKRKVKNQKLSSDVWGLSSH